MHSFDIRNPSSVATFAAGWPRAFPFPSNIFRNVQRGRKCHDTGLKRTCGYRFAPQLVIIGFKHPTGHFQVCTYVCWIRSEVVRKKCQYQDVINQKLMFLRRQETRPFFREHDQQLTIYSLWDCWCLLSLLFLFLPLGYGAVPCQ
jgi:hypothetical protein